MTFEQWLADRGLVASGQAGQVLLSLVQRASLEKDYNALVAAGVIAAAGGGDPADPGTAEQVIADLRARRAAEISAIDSSACNSGHM